MRTVKTYLIMLLASVFMACSTDDDNSNTSAYTNAETLLEDVNFQGFAIITKNGEDLVRQGFGLANESTGLAQDFYLPYRIASVSKTLTAAAVVQLQRDGLITSFDQTLDAFDANFPNGNQITIRHLLSHQSGIPDYLSVVEDAYEQGFALDTDEIYEVITDIISENGLYFTPGSGKQYSNSNFFIAALLVEELTDMSFHDYVAQHIFTPLGMTNSFKGTNILNTTIHAQGYQNGIENSTYPMTIAFGAGDFSSSPEDMEIWINAVKNNWFTTAEKTEIFVENVPSGYVDFGLGWFTTQEGNTTMYWHGGDIDGYWSMIGFIPEYDATIVLLSNEQSDDQASQRGIIIEQLLTQEFVN